MDLGFDPESFQKTSPFNVALSSALAVPGEFSQMQNAPQLAKQQLLQAIAATQQQQALAQYAPQLAQANAQKAQQLAQNPLLSLPGVAGQLGAYEYLQRQQGMPSIGSQENAGSVATAMPGQAPALNGAQQVALQNKFQGQQMTVDPAEVARLQQAGQGSQSDLSNTLLGSITSGIRKSNALADLDTKRASAYQYMSLPPDNKRQLLAQAAAMGYDPQTASQHLMQGQSMADLARAHGFDPSNLPAAQYAPTAANITALQKRQQAVAEIDPIQSFISESTSPYSRKFLGYSPKLTLQQIAGEDKEAQARALAAKALNPELSALRIRALGGNVGITAIHEITNAGLGQLKVFEGGVAPDVYQRSQELVQQQIQNAMTNANSVLLGGKPTASNQSMPTSSGARIKVISPDGKRGTISSENLQEALHSGYRQVS